MSEKFEYKYSAPTQRERKEVDSIRSQYLPKEEVMTNIDRLKELDKKVKNPPLITSLSFGIVGTLIFGLGLTCVLEWNLIGLGIGLMIFGGAVLGVAYPIYNKLLNKLKRKYGPTIINLSNQILNEE
jgi:hypothetical protein